MNDFVTSTVKPGDVCDYRQIVGANVIDLRDTYRRRANWNRHLFRASGSAVIVLSASLPLLAGLSYEGKDITVAIVGVIIAILTGLRAFFQWDQLWGFLRQSDFALTHLVAKWELDVATASALADGQKDSEVYRLTGDLLDKTEEVRKAESQNYFGTLHYPEGKIKDSENSNSSDRQPS